MFKIKLKYSKRFYLGIILLALNFILGALAKVIFFLHFNDLFWFWFSIVLYSLSLVMLVLGIWWVGAEYSAALKKYFTYRYYHESLKSGTRKIHNKVKDK